MATSDALAPYKHKRDFSRTHEPAGAVEKPRQALSFVIQKHAARNLHYDFRLELDGTLKSWAVPKGPSLDPSVKRMAVHVEDHPLSYANFEGVIPPKQYGAGTVIVWDNGTWVPIGDPHAGYRDGKLSFELRGTKLQGRWKLVRMKQRDGERQEAWLLMKERDEHVRLADEFDVLEALPGSVLTGAAPAAAGTQTVPPARSPAGKTKAGVATRKLSARKPASRSRSARVATGVSTVPALPEGATPAPLPDTLSPPLATLVDDVPSEGDWLFEIKFDGYRILVRIEGDSVRCFTRNGNDWTRKLPALVEAIRSAGWGPGWLDGEIIVPDGDGKPDFQSLQNAFDRQNTSRIQYFVFDAPFYAGHDLRAVPVEERRAFLKAVMGGQESPMLHFSEAFEVEPDVLLESARRAGLEGVLGKRKGSPYRSVRSSDWIKLKCEQRQEFVVGGYIDPKGTRTGIGSLLLGVHDEQGQLRYAGNVGTGFDVQTLSDLKKRLQALRTPQAPFANPPAKVGARKDSVPHWVKPSLIAEVSFAQWTQDGYVRQAVFHGLRDDKPAASISCVQGHPPRARDR
jgi:bifunctional non-homologous end joining protein LigD